MFQYVPNSPWSRIEYSQVTWCIDSSLVGMDYFCGQLEGCLKETVTMAAVLLPLFMVEGCQEVQVTMGLIGLSSFSVADGNSSFCSLIHKILVC